MLRFSIFVFRYLSEGLLIEIKLDKCDFRQQKQIILHYIIGVRSIIQNL